MPMAHITKIEDARTGQWLRHLDPAEDPITRIDYGWTMGDWNQLDVGLETVALRKSSRRGSKRVRPLILCQNADFCDRLVQMGRLGG